MGNKGSISACIKQSSVMIRNKRGISFLAVKHYAPYCEFNTSAQIRKLILKAYY